MHSLSEKQSVLFAYQLIILRLKQKEKLIFCKWDTLDQHKYDIIENEITSHWILYIHVFNTAQLLLWACAHDFNKFTFITMKNTLLI